VSILDQIAKEAGVSAMTVARVLKGERSYARPSAELRARSIREIAARFHYRPSQAAKAVRTGRFGTLALIIPEQAEGGRLPTELLDGILAETESRDLLLNISRAVPGGTRPARLWRERSADGQLLVGALTGVPGLPAVTLGRHEAGDCVVPDESGAGRQATVLLRHLGHRAIAFIGEVGSVVVAERLAGYRQGLDGSAAQIIEPADADRFAWARRLLATPNRPSAVVCGTSSDAVPVLMAASELGIQVPQALSVIAIDTDDVALQLGFTPTRIALPFYAIGRLGVSRLCEKIADPQTVLPPLSVPFTLRDGGTCAPPAG
jgi:LacI family transcriptional regulator